MDNMTTNTNCLADMQCACGSIGPFMITVMTVVKMTDDGADMKGDLSFDNNSPCQCYQCFKMGKVADFKKISECLPPILP